MLPSFCRESVVVARPGSRESRGVTLPDWANPVETVVAGCSVQPSFTSGADAELRVNQVSEGMRVYMPPGADVRAGDKVVWGGRDWKVDGEPQPWESPSGRVSHVVVDVVRWEG